jgi:DNA-directed RNA polymerase beta' subunit
VLLQRILAGTVSKITLDNTNRLYYTTPTIRRLTMLDYDTLAELADIYKEKYNRLLETNNRLEEMLDAANEKIEILTNKA